MKNSCKTEDDSSPNNKKKAPQNAVPNFPLAGMSTHIWTDAEQRELLQAVLQEQLFESQVYGNISSQGWTHVTERMKNKFGRDFHPGGLRNQLHHLRETYLDIKFLQHRFGFRWDEKSCMINAAPTTWLQLMKENPFKSYSELRNRPGPIGWYPLTQRLFGAGSLSNRNPFPYLPFNENKREDIPNNPAHSAIHSGFANPPMPLVSKRKNETNLSDDRNARTHVDPIFSSASRAVKQPRLSDQKPTTKEKGASTFQTVPANASEKIIQPTPIIKGENSQAACVKNEPSPSNLIDKDFRAAPNSPTSRKDQKPLERFGFARKEAPLTSGSDNFTKSLPSQQNNKTIPSADHSNLAYKATLFSASEVKKQPRLSNGDMTSQTVQGNAPKETVQPPPAIKSESSRPDPPIKDETSTKPCVTERKSESPSSNPDDKDADMVLSFSASRAQHKPDGSSRCAKKESSGSENLMKPLASHKKDEKIPTADRGKPASKAPLALACEASKQPRLANHGLDKNNGHGASQTVPADAPKKTVQPAPVIKNEDDQPDPPVKDKTSTKPCVAERQSEPPASNRVANDAGKVPSSSTAGPPHQPAGSPGHAEREERPALNNAPEREIPRQEEDNPRSPNPTIRAITTMAPMFVNQVSPLEYVQFVQVVENRTNAEIFLSLVSTTNPIICKTWLQQKSRTL
ncbi:hypothetical protein PTTG_05291 [Puccinia triticina 1-1 BBBD Race 1]|uniref:Myb_DNA-bind_3 domain-containing protein n=1 Tax=Puccinia triticina (isolate 1-1 / race 1 (BBBD)) TaxID=630390 RepID=A0A180H2K6_PUCT1|nr:hypothetical protein PTTG_05291 [Puccinia triticina 1-1 BBBD Race 1]WAR58439.1 hypothetical protein PtB15_5B673 [Puccinia triticina]